jgi:hypothetical protein
VEKLAIITAHTVLGKRLPNASLASPPNGRQDLRPRALGRIALGCGNATFS